MTQIRILHVMNNFFDSSISRIVERIVRSLGNSRYEWHVGDLSGYGDMEAALKRLGVKTVHFSPQQTHRWRAWRIRSYVQEHEIHIIHTHTPRAICAVSLAGLKGVRHMATKHLLTTRKDRRWGVLYAILDYLTLYSPDRLIPVSESMAEQVKALPGIRAERVTTVRNAIPCEEFYRPDERAASRRELGLAPDQVTFGYAGRFDPVKLIDQLLLAFACVYASQPEARLLLIGEGSQRVALEQYAQSLGIADAVIWTGYRADIARL